MGDETFATWPRRPEDGHGHKKKRCLKQQKKVWIYQIYPSELEFKEQKWCLTVTKNVGFTSQSGILANRNWDLATKIGVQQLKIGMPIINETWKLPSLQLTWTLPNVGIGRVASFVEIGSDRRECVPWGASYQQRCWINQHQRWINTYVHIGMSQNLVAVWFTSKIAGKQMFIPLNIVILGIDPSIIYIYIAVSKKTEGALGCIPSRSLSWLGGTSQW